MIDRSFVEKIEELSVPNFHEQDDITRSDKNLYAIQRPLAKGIASASLASIVSYMTGCCDMLQKDGPMVIHITGHDHVSLNSALSPDHRVRETYVNTELDIDRFVFDHYLSVEKFIINLQAKFVPCDMTAAILSVVGNITQQAECGTQDNGVTQTVTTKQGIAKIGMSELPRRIPLKPFRTFGEIEQPESEFILRIKGFGEGETPSCGLFGADGGAWKEEAVNNIAGYFEDALETIKEANEEGVSVPKYVIIK